MVLNLNGNKKTIKSLPLLDRPRERALYYGINTLSESELLAIIIGEGTSERNALHIAEDLLAEHVSLTNLYRLTSPREIKTHGIGSAKALRLLACFELNKRLLSLEGKGDGIKYEQARVITNYRHKIGHLKKETLYLLSLNRRNMIINEKQLYVGSDSGFKVDAKEVVRELLLTNAERYVLIHNHPSGDVKPSEADIETTYALAKMSAKFGVYLYDHLIIGAHDAFSIRDQAGATFLPPT